MSSLFRSKNNAQNQNNHKTRFWRSILNYSKSSNKEVANISKKINLLPKLLNKKEIIIIIIASLLIGLSLIFWALLFYFNNSSLSPKLGGEYIEGIAGAPQFINPILSQTNDVDRDVSKLIFSGLFKEQEGRLEKDLIENYEVSEDKKIYTFKLKPEVKWHDQEPFTARDVLFTVQAIQNKAFQSSLYRSLENVNIKLIDDYTIEFQLAEPYAPFLSLLTFGILPEHIWSHIEPENARLSEFNLKTPIGTGPYQIESLKHDEKGVLKSYSLIRNSDYYLQKPYLEKLIFKFYPDFRTALDALNLKNIDGLNFLPNNLHAEITNKEILIKSLALSQYTAVFFNQENLDFLRDKKVRQALTFSLDKKKILKQALADQGAIINAPILPGQVGFHPNIPKYDFSLTEAEKKITEANFKKISPEEYKKLTEEPEESSEQSGDNTAEDKKASEIKKILTASEKEADKEPKQEPKLLNNYWQKNNQVLEITLTTVKQTETLAAVKIIQELWQSIGIKTNLEIIESNKILEVIKERNFQTLLYGQIIGQDPDPYAFWHSSQITSDGYNIANFVNNKVDILLEEARLTDKIEERAVKYIEFQNILAEELPAIFLYNPTYSYILHSKIKGFELKVITKPSDRFSSIEKWYIKTKRKLN